MSALWHKIVYFKNVPYMSCKYANWLTCVVYLGKGHNVLECKICQQVTQKAFLDIASKLKAVLWRKAYIRTAKLSFKCRKI